MNRTQKLTYFLERGPGYIFAYVRWKCRRLVQRMFGTRIRAEACVSDRDALRRLRQTSAPVFLFTDDQVESIAGAVPERLRNDTIAAADELCQNRFRFRSSKPVQFGARIDWHLSDQSDPDWRWDLNRHGYFETLGFAYRYSNDEKYAQKFAVLLEDWLEQNPPSPVEANWSSAFEVGYRINSWTWAYFLFRRSPSLTDRTIGRLLQGISTHCQFLDRNLELHVRNNHLLLEAKALAFAGTLFGDFGDARRWQRRGLAHVCDEVREQVLADGVHGEMSTHYHRIVTGELLELHALLKATDVRLPADIVDLLGRMVDYQRRVTGPDGQLALIGDSSLEDTYDRVPVLETAALLRSTRGPGTAGTSAEALALWRSGAFHDARANLPMGDDGSGSIAYPYGGMVFIASGGQDVAGPSMMLDCGPFGLTRDPHHGHADALSVQLQWNRRHWLVDSGVFSTHTDWEWRRYFRGTRSHNTVMIDDEDQSLLLDSRRARLLARSTCRQWLSNGNVHYIDAHHDGYQRLRSPVRHRRQIWFVHGRYVVIVDTLLGGGSHNVEVNFHFPADVTANILPDKNTCRARDGAGDAIDLQVRGPAGLELAVMRGSHKPVQGWRSRLSGAKQPADTLSARLNDTCPLSIATLISPVRSATDGVTPTIVEFFADAENDLTALVLDTDEGTDVLCSTGRPDGSRHFRNYVLDIPVAWIRETRQGKAPDTRVQRGSPQPLSRAVTPPFRPGRTVAPWP